MSKRKNLSKIEFTGIFLLLKAILIFIFFISSDLLALEQLSIYEQMVAIDRKNYFPYIALDSNGKYIAVTNTPEGTVSIFDLRNSLELGKVDKQKHIANSETNSIILPADTILMAADNTEDHNDASSKLSIYKQLLIYKMPNLTNNPAPTVINNEAAFPLSVAFSPEISGNYYLAIAYSNNSILIYNMADLSSPRFTIDTNINTPISVAFSSEISGNCYLAIANYGANTIGISTYNKSLNSFDTPIPMIVGDKPCSVIFSPDINGNYYLATANSNLSEQESSSLSIIKIDNSFTIEQIIRVKSTNKIESIAFSQDGKHLAAATDGLDEINLYSYLDPADRFTQVAGSPFKIFSNYSEKMDVTIPYCIEFGNNNKYIVFANKLFSYNNIFSFNQKITIPEKDSQIFADLCEENSIYIPESSSLIYNTDENKQKNINPRTKLGLPESLIDKLNSRLARSKELNPDLRLTNQEANYEIEGLYEPTEACKINENVLKTRACKKGTASVDEKILSSSQNVQLQASVTANVQTSFLTPGSPTPIGYAWVLSKTTSSPFSKAPFPSDLKPPVLYTTGTIMSFSVYPGSTLQCAAIYKDESQDVVSGPITFEYPAGYNPKNPLLDSNQDVVFTCYNCQNIIS